MFMDVVWCGDWWLDVRRVQAFKNFLSPNTQVLFMDDLA